MSEIPIVIIVIVIIAGLTLLLLWEFWGRGWDNRLK